jgi:hypothetical protein
VGADPQESEIKVNNDAEVAEVIEASKSAPKIDGSAGDPVPMSRQFGHLLRKSFRTYWRSPSYNITRMVVIAVMAAMYGSIYWQQGNAISGTPSQGPPSSPFSHQSELAPKTTIL